MIYDSKDELLHDICANFLIEYLEKFIKSQTDNIMEQKNIIIQTFYDLKEQERLIRAIWNIHSEKFNPYLTMQESIYKLTYRYMYQKHKDKENDNSLELFSLYYAASTMETIKWWLDHYENISAEYLYKIIETCLNRGMIHVL